MPVINYVFNYEFYKTVLCENKAKPDLKCNGKCYLIKEMKISNQQNKDAKLPIPRVDLSKLPISLIEKYTLFEPFIFKEKRIQKYAKTTVLAFNVDINVLTPPPDYR